MATFLVTFFFNHNFTLKIKAAVEINRRLPSLLRFQ
jgi:hypothetical protein